MALRIDLEAGLRPPPPPERGTPDGRLVFKKLLGQGAEGLVYLAVPARRRQQQQQQQGLASSRRPPSAVKVVNGGRAFERCRASRGLWPQLVHPNIVYPQESWWDDANGRCFVQMELCQTDMLDLVCDTGALEDERGSVFAGHLASALVHLHGQGIAHQDVKLENIFVSRDGVAKLGDIGSIVQILPHAIQQDDEEESSTPSEGDDDFIDSSFSSSFVGSVMYAPPEVMRRISRGSSSWVTGPGIHQHHHQQHEDRRDPFAADMWALGVSIWSAMAGCHPWELACVDRSKEFRTFVRQGAAATLPASFSPGLRSLLARLLSLDPRKRPTAAEVLASRWVSAPPTTPPTYSSRGGRPGASTIHSWPCAFAPSGDEDRSGQQQQLQPSQRQPAPVTPTSTNAENSRAALLHSDGAAAAAAAAATTVAAAARATPAGRSGGLVCFPEQGRLFSDASGEADAAAGCRTAMVAAGGEDAPRTEEALEAEAEVVSPATTVATIEPSPIRSRHRRYKKRKAPEEEEEEERGRGEVAAAREKNSGFVVEHLTEREQGRRQELEQEALALSPEMNALGDVLLNGRRGCSGGGGRGNNRRGERPTKIARVSPSPLTLPEGMMMTAAEEEIERRRGCHSGSSNNNNNNAINAMKAVPTPSSPSALFAGLGTQQSLLQFFEAQSPPTPVMWTLGEGGRSALDATQPVPTSARAAAAASGSIWGAVEGAASSATISFKHGERGA